MSCREACIEAGFEDAIDYGITKKYADTREWGVWELFREVMQNALDEIHVIKGERPWEYPCRVDYPYTIVYDYGRGLSIVNLLIGASEKKPWQRGKFGEGLKLALLVATARGYDVVIRSGDKEIKPIFATRVIEGRPVDVFCVCYRKGLKPITGTEVRIRQPDLCREFQSGFVQGIYAVDPKCILYSVYETRKVILEENTEKYEEYKAWYDIIDKRCTDGKATIYVRDIFVTPVNKVFSSRMTAFFSYNLFDVVLDESRRIPSPVSVNVALQQMYRLIAREAVYRGDRRAREIMKTLMKYIVDSCEKAARRALEFQPIETDTMLFFFFGSDENQLLVDLFNELYGEDVALINRKDLYDFAVYVGAKAIFCPLWVGSELEDILGSVNRIKKYVTKRMKEAVPKERMSKDLRDVVEVLEGIANILFGDELSGKVVNYMVMDPDTGGVADLNTKTIFLNIARIDMECRENFRDCIEWYISTLGHELAHIITGAADGTTTFESGLTDLMGKTTYRAVIHAGKISDLMMKLKRLVEKRAK